MSDILNKSEQKALAGIAGALADFNGIYSEMTALQMRCFIIVARRGSLTGKEMALALDVSGSNISRCVAALSDITVARRKVAPLGLVTLANDPIDRRVKYVQLSTKGEAFAKALTSHF
jgi:DNA-binding MarR family transcriptional regulator|tara:strand:+ start:165 stop:518 length:354 start_codon:yes stop_codon:yes gene_type:complete